MLLCWPARAQPLNSPNLLNSVGGEDVVGSAEGLQGDLPVAVEAQPSAPFAPHVLQPERVEDLGGGCDSLRRFAIGVHVDPQPAAPGVHADRAQVGVGRQSRLASRPVPGCACTPRPNRVVQLWNLHTNDLRARPERCGRRAGNVDGACGRGAHVVVRVNWFWAGSHDDDRIVLQDVIGPPTSGKSSTGRPAARPCATADRSARAYPGRYAPSTGIVIGFGQFVDVSSDPRMASRKDSSFRNSDDVVRTEIWLRFDRVHRRPTGSGPVM